MSEKPISPLRRRMLKDIAVRRFGENAQSNHIRQIETFTLFLGRSPTRQQQRTCFT
jgi:integrase/recombinase XerD